MTAKTAVYAGSFDPVTLGHLDLIKRAVRLFDRVIVAVGKNPNKKHMFSDVERVDMINTALRSEEETRKHHVEVTVFDDFLVDYAEKMDAVTLIRGLRTGSDLDSELGMVFTNRRINDKVDTIFLTPKEEYGFVSSSVVRELIGLGADVNTLAKFIPESVFDYIEE